MMVNVNNAMIEEYRYTRYLYLHYINDVDKNYNSVGWFIIILFVLNNKNLNFGRKIQRRMVVF